MKYLLGSSEQGYLPSSEEGFMEQMDAYFCNYYDIKEIKRDFIHLNGGLSRIAKDLDISRIGTMH